MKKETEAGVQKKEKSKDKMASPDSTFLDICAPEAKLYLCPSSGSVVKPPQIMGAGKNPFLPQAMCVSISEIQNHPNCYI